MLFAQQIGVGQSGRRGVIIRKQIVLVILTGVHLLKNVARLNEQAKSLIDAAIDAVVELFARHVALFVDDLIETGEFYSTILIAVVDAGAVAVAFEGKLFDQV